MSTRKMSRDEASKFVGGDSTEVSQVVVTAATSDVINFRPISVNFFNNPNYFLNGNQYFYDTQWIFPAVSGPDYTYSYGVERVTSDQSTEALAILQDFQGVGTQIYEAMGPNMAGYNVQFPALAGIPTANQTIAVTSLGALMETMNFRVVANNVNFGRARGGANVYGNVSVRANTLVGYAAQYAVNYSSSPSAWFHGYKYLYLHELAHNTPAGKSLNDYYGGLHYAQYQTYSNYDDTSVHFRNHEMAIHQLAMAIGQVIGFPLPSTPPYSF